MEPNVYDIDDSEPTTKEIVGNWLAMGVAMSWIVVTLPFFGLALLLLRYGHKDVQIPTPSIKPTLP